MRKYEVRDRALGKKLSRPFIVPTPCPYIIDLADFENPESTKKRLLRKVETLYHILATLGIGLIEANREQYSLNPRTADALYNRAITAMCDECDSKQIAAIKDAIRDINGLNQAMAVNTEETAQDKPQ